MTVGFLDLFNLKRLLGCALALIVFFVHAISGQRTPVNSADLYKANGIAACKFNSHFINDSLFIYAELSFKNPPSDSLKVQVTVIEVDQNEITQEVSLFHALEKRPNGNYLYKWGYGANTYPAKLIIKVFTQPRAWIFVESITPELNHPTGGVLLQEPEKPYPLMKTHGLVGDRIQVNVTTPRDSVYAYYYSHAFDPARPPINLKLNKKNSSLMIDSVFAWPVATPIKLSQPGLYFIQADTSSIEGVAFLVAPVGYPKPQQISQLTEPLIYLTTKEEYTDLRQDITNKKAFDKFWLSTVGSPHKARNSIKHFYQLVEAANVHFSSYKEGWKTDRGMIYTIMGPPLVVIKSKNKEVWEYRRAGDFTINFSFQKVSNIFSNNHYELVRKESLDRYWFIAIDRWRQGLIGL